MFRGDSERSSCASGRSRRGMSGSKIQDVWHTNGQKYQKSHQHACCLADDRLSFPKRSSSGQSVPIDAPRSINPVGWRSAQPVADRQVKFPNGWNPYTASCSDAISRFASQACSCGLRMTRRASRSTARTWMAFGVHAQSFSWPEHVWLTRADRHLRHRGSFRHGTALCRNRFSDLRPWHGDTVAICGLRRCRTQWVRVAGDRGRGVAPGPARARW